ncbi:hypothetical protein O181_059213 [Austropuccinia psidii MF-1]|uniref:Secreted protein n=1 Tax=Austropuccinia psidii MF-1 TaxID=1389203 RepID=A0A9Q3EEF5_9BASI|nr:hypothetical protein [Austropuccinia psidii MF-1]
MFSTCLLRLQLLAITFNCILARPDAFPYDPWQNNQGFTHQAQCNFALKGTGIKGHVECNSGIHVFQCLLSHCHMGGPRGHTTKPPLNDLLFTGCWDSQIPTIKLFVVLARDFTYHPDTNQIEIANGIPKAPAFDRWDTPIYCQQQPKIRPWCDACKVLRNSNSLTQ